MSDVLSTAIKYVRAMLHVIVHFAILTNRLLGPRCVLAKGRKDVFGRLSDQCD